MLGSWARSSTDARFLEIRLRPACAGASIDVPVIAGTTKDETTVLFPPPDAFTLDWAGLKKHFTTLFPCADADKLIADMRALRPQETPSDLYFTVSTELWQGR